MRRASDLDDLVFHALAYVPPAAQAPPASRAASLYWPAYVERARGLLPREACELFEQDAPLLSAMLAPTPVAHAIALLCELHPSIAELRRLAPRELRELLAEEVSAPWALEALRGLPLEPVELLRADLALAAPAFAEAHPAVLAPHAERVRAAVEAAGGELGPLWASLELGEVEVSATLGLRGRGFAARVVVGSAALPGEPVDPLPTLALALHERVVQRASAWLQREGRDPAWQDVEAVALAVEQRLVAGTVVEPAHAAWLASLDLRGVSELAASGLAPLAEALARDLDAPPPRRKNSRS